MRYLLSKSGLIAFVGSIATAAAIGLAGCGEESETTSDGLHTPLEAQTIELRVTLPEETTLDDVAIVAGKKLDVGDKASVEEPSDVGALIANVGNASTELGEKAHTGPVLSIAPVELSRNAVVDGDVKSSGAIVNRGADVSGALLPGVSIPTRTELIDVASVPAGGANGIVLGPGENRTLAPGAYRGLIAGFGSTLRLTAGRYFFGLLDLKPGSHLEIDDSQGPAIVYVIRRLGLAAEVVDLDPAPLALLVAYVGPHDVKVAGLFRGTLIATQAEVEVLPACADRHPARRPHPTHPRHGGRGRHGPGDPGPNHHGGGHRDEHQASTFGNSRHGRPGHHGDPGCRGEHGNCCDDAHEGAFFGKRVKVHERARIVHVSFPWDRIRVGQEVTPVLTCVAPEGTGSFAAFLGYTNTSASPIDIPVGFSNQLTPTDFVVAQPTTFQPGTHTGFFVVRFDARGLTWRLGGGSVTATSTSTPCQPLGPNEDDDDGDDPAKFPPQPDGIPPTAGSTFQESSSSGVPFAMLRQVPRNEPLQAHAEDSDDELVALIHGDRGTRAVEVVLVNSTNLTLSFGDGEGEGAITTQPPSAIGPNSYGTWETRDGQALQGTGGFTTFTSGSNLLVAVFWNNPFIGANDYSFSLAGPDAGQFTVDRVGGSGNKATVFFILRRVTDPQTNCPNGSFQWIVDNLRTMEEPLGNFDMAIGFLSTPAKRITGVKNWAATGCRISRVVGVVRQVALSTDGFFTIDVLLDEFEGVLLTSTNKAIRIEVDPTRGGIPNPATAAILAAGGPPAIGTRIIFFGDVLIDHGSFLEVHPTTPIQNAPACSTFPPGTEPLFCSTVLQNIFSVTAGSPRTLMGRVPGRACFLTRVDGFMTSPEAELSATIDATTGDWVLNATQGTLEILPGIPFPVPLGGAARCVAVTELGNEGIWTAGQPAVFLTNNDSTSDCFFTRVGGTWTNGGGAFVDTFAPITVGPDSNPPAAVGIRAGARCMGVQVSTFPQFVLNPAPSPRIFMNGINEACLFKQIRGAFNSGIVEILPDATTSLFRWTLGNAGNNQGAAAACATLAP
jgi:hypothetical protein